MGAQQSKVRIAIPSKARCFPGYCNERELFDTTKKIKDCHMQTVQIATWIATKIFPTSSVAPVLFSGATMLFTFLLSRLSPSLSSNNNNNPPPQSSNNNSKITQKSGASQTENPRDRTLEDALIDSKVSTAIAKKSVCELQAKICVVKNRYSRLLSEISPDDRRLEVVPAVQTCEEILQLFHDPTHVFRQHPLVSSPFLVTFAGIFVAVAELSLVLIPSYREPFVKEMKLMMDTLTVYKRTCIKSRLDGIRFKSMKPATMLDAVSGSTDINYTMEDSCLPKKTGGGIFSSKAETASDYYEDDDMDLDESLDRVYNDANEAISAYRNALEGRYSLFFDTALDTVSKFSGFNAEHEESSDDDANEEEEC